MRNIIKYFFTDNNTPSAYKISDLQRRATWIALALILQALNEIDHNYYLPILKQFTSLPPLFLLLGSFYALWMAIRPAPPIMVGTGSAQDTGSAQGTIPTVQQPRLWQRIILFLTLILTIPGAIQIGYT